VAIVAPLLIFIYPPQGSSKPKDFTIRLDKPLTGLNNGDALKFAAPAEAGFLMQDGGGDNAPGKIAFAGYVVKNLAGAVSVYAVNCSHLGCSVAFNTGAIRFECPCHGSMFNINGQVIHGPAAFPLSHLTWQRGGAPDQILVQGLDLKGIG
jgi:Rieske Fe-S protein